MRGDLASMLRPALILSAICGLVQSSGVGHVLPAAPIASGAGLVPVAALAPVQPVIQRTPFARVAPVPAVAHVVPRPPPVVTAASSQYFERTFNRLVAVPPVVPVAPAPPVFTNTLSVVPIPVAPAPVAPIPFAPVAPSKNVPVEPNVAIAVATAHAAAPVATILLPPYPFGPPPSLGFLPSSPPVFVPEEPKSEPTTPPPTQIDVNIREPEPTTPQPSNTDNSFVQALPSNENVNFKQYGPPFPPQTRPLNNGNNFNQALPSNQNVNFKQYGLPLPPAKPQKLKTIVEVVPVPLVYMAPPPISHSSVKSAHYHTFVPARTKIIIRPVLDVPLRIRTVKVPARLVIHGAPVSAKTVGRRYNNALRRPVNTRDIEPTTIRPFKRPNTKPPRL